MKPSNRIYNLIHSLSPAEKIYIKKYATISNDNKYNYHKLMEAINKQEVYDEKALLKQFKKEPFAKHFAVTKNQLFELILKLLRQYDHKNNIRAIINAAIENGELLYKRGLPDLGLKQLDKAYKLAKEHASYLKMKEVLDLKRHYIAQLQAHDWRAGIDDLLEEKQELLNAEMEQVFYAKTYAKFLFLSRQKFLFRDSNQQEELENLLPSGQLSPPQYEHFYSQLYYLNIKNLYYFLKKDFGEAIVYIKKIIALWDHHPKLIQKDPELYMAALNTYMNNAHMNKDWYGLEYVAPKLKNIPQKSIRMQAMVFENETFWRINYYQMLRRYAEIFQLMPEIERTLKRLKNSIHKVRYFMFVRFIAYIYFIFGDYNKALEYLNQTLTLKHISMREDLQLFVNMMLLFTHYRLGNIIFLESALKNYRRKIKKKGLLYELEDFQLRLLLKLCAAKDRTTTNQLLDAFQNELTILIENNPNLQAVLQIHFSLKTWMESVKKDCIMKILLEQRKEIWD